MASTRFKGRRRAGRQADHLFTRPRLLACLAACALGCGLAILCCVRSASEDDSGIPGDAPASTDERSGGGGSVTTSESVDGAGVPEDVTSWDGEGQVADQLESLAREAGSTVKLEETDEEVLEAAAALIGRYRDEGTCLLMSSGYLDLLGRVWGCVVEGPGWVDLCVVEEQTDGGSVVRTVRLFPQKEEVPDVA